MLSILSLKGDCQRLGSPSYAILLFFQCFFGSCIPRNDNVCILNVRRSQLCTPQLTMVLIYGNLQKRTLDLWLVKWTYRYMAYLAAFLDVKSSCFHSQDPKLKLTRSVMRSGHVQHELSSSRWDMVLGSVRLRFYMTFSTLNCEVSWTSVSESECP